MRGLARGSKGKVKFGFFGFRFSLVFFVVLPLIHSQAIASSAMQRRNRGLRNGVSDASRGCRESAVCPALPHKPRKISHLERGGILDQKKVNSFHLNHQRRPDSVLGNKLHVCRYASTKPSFQFGPPLAPPPHFNRLTTSTTLSCGGT